MDTPAGYDRVQAILDGAAGQSTASYEGQGRFWRWKLAEFLEVSLYGVPMIASASASASGRGAASGLVRGLRGQFPFDGTQFPPLPWGGDRVAPADIDFIERWIDAGCAEDLDGYAAAALRRDALASGQAAYPEHDGPANQILGAVGAPKQRKNILSLSAEEWCRLRAAIAQMKSLDAYYQDERSFGYWARIHANQCQHGWEEFLTWHRAYLYFFELQLQDVDPTVTLPYWDWTADAANVRTSIEDSQSAAGCDNGVIPEAYRCWITEDGLQRLEAAGTVPRKVLGGLRATIGAAYNSGARLFTVADIAYGDDPASDKAIFAELDRINPLFHQFRWPGGDKSLIFEAYPTPGDVEDILRIQNFFDFASGKSADRFFGALENIHNLIHNYTGGASPYANAKPATGDMVNAGVTAFDPIFWAHHANVDRLWSEWQRRNPSVGPDNPGAILPPWTITVADTASIQALGYEYAMASHVFPTGSRIAQQRFRSAAVLIRPHVLANYRHAEVRLHAVRQTARPGFYIRAFLNTPDAGVATPTRGNDHYVGQAAMFTGVCVGGPGHCEVPAPTTNKFDRRPAHHKSASSIRFDATEAVRKLAAAGAPDLHVNLVVLNIDGTPATDALRLDAVSLNFRD